MRRKAIIAAAVVGLCLGVVVTRAIWEGRSALHRGDEAAARGDLREAVRWYRRAARWYVPLAPHVGRAYDKLEAVGAQAEQAGDLELAVMAWSGVRTSINATRSFYTPHAERLDPANRKLAALMAQWEGDAADPGKTPAEREQWHYDLLQRDHAPSVGWSIVALLGFGLWIGGGFLFALRGVSAEDALVPRPAATAGLMVACGLVIWMLGLYKA